MPGGWQQRGGSSEQTLFLAQRLPQRPQLLLSRSVSTQVPPGLAPQQVGLGKVQAAPAPQRQVLSVQVLDDPRQVALSQQLPSSHLPSQQMPLAIASVLQRVRSSTGVYWQICNRLRQAPVLQTTSSHGPQSTGSPQLFGV